MMNCGIVVLATKVKTRTGVLLLCVHVGDEVPCCPLFVALPVHISSQKDLPQI